MADLGFLPQSVVSSTRRQLTVRDCCTPPPSTPPSTSSPTATFQTRSGTVSTVTALLSPRWLTTCCTSPAADRLPVLIELTSGPGRKLVFTRTKHRARLLARQLSEAGVPAGEMHSNLTQARRIRNLAEFSSGRANVLVATDLAARGLHIDDVELVIHADPPLEHKAYLHRSGRTARGRSGRHGCHPRYRSPTRRCRQGRAASRSEPCGHPARAREAEASATSSHDSSNVAAAIHRFLIEDPAVRGILLGEDDHPKWRGRRPNSRTTPDTRGERVRGA